MVVITRLVLAASLLIAQPAVGGVINVSYTAQPGQRAVTDQAGAALSSGNEVRVGYFTSGFDVSANATDLAALQAAWVSYQPDDPNRFIRTLSGQPGRFTSTHTREVGTFTGNKVYLWIFKTNDSLSPVAGFGNVVEYGLFSGTDLNWVFPSDDSPLSNSITVTSSQVDEASFGSFDSESIKLRAVPITSLTYDAWELQTFSAVTPASDRDPTDNPDGDGLNNGLEYLVGSNPEEFSETPFTGQISGDRFVVTYPRMKSVPPGTDIVEVSTDLVNWMQDVTVTSSSSDLNDLQTLVTISVPMAGLDMRFMHIVVDVSHQ